MLSSKIKFAVENGFNILFIGKHGVGKTKETIAEWQNLGYTDDPNDVDKKLYMYFNCPVLDVYEDLKGLPYQKDGKMDYIKPSHRDWDRVELIFLDEPNRAHPKVINSLYELIQLRSVNGIKLPNLRSVFAAMNPHGEDYAVEACDNSFFDRFHLKINVEADLDLKFFVEKKGLSNEKFNKVRAWWKAIPENIRDNEVSPRRVEYCLDVAKAGGVLGDVIPFSANPLALQNILNDIDIKPDETNLNIDEHKTFLDNYKNFAGNGADIVQILKSIPKEVLMSHFTYDKSSFDAKMASTQKANDFINFLQNRNVLEEVIDYIAVPNLLIAVLKSRCFIKSRQRAFVILNKDFPALAAKWKYPMY